MRQGYISIFILSTKTQILTIDIFVTTISIMIKQGDKFTFKELQASMREVCDYNIHKYINPRQSLTNILIGRCPLELHKCTPDEYADIAVQAYEYESSAHSLDQQLADKDFKTTYRFSHKYHNGGMTSAQIIHDAYCLDYFYQMYRCGRPYKNRETVYINALDDAFRLSYYYMQYLSANNRYALADIAHALNAPDVTQWGQIISVLQGIGFQFHPTDIYEHAINLISPDITKRQFDKQYASQLAFKENMKDKYGIDTGCLVLSSQNREKLRKIVTKTDTPYFLQVIKKFISIQHR